MEDGETPSMYDSFFEITVSLCDRFTSLNPIQVRKYPMHEVILLMKRTVNHNRNKKKSRKIMKPASDNAGWW